MLIQHDGCPYEKTVEHRHIEGRPCEDTGEDGHPQAKERERPQEEPADNLHLISSLLSCEEIHFDCRSTSPWHFVMSALAE